MNFDCNERTRAVMRVKKSRGAGENSCFRREHPSPDKRILYEVQPGSTECIPGDLRGRRRYPVRADSQESPGLEALKLEIIQEIQSRYSLDTGEGRTGVQGLPGLFLERRRRPHEDPAGFRSAGEKDPLRRNTPGINTAVDAYNLASVRSGIPIAAFDADTLAGDLTLRFAGEGEPSSASGWRDRSCSRRTRSS